MDLALSAATVAVSRAGASSLAEMAAMELPAILIPYPAAADDHQYHNARTLAQPGASRMLVQSQLKPELLASAILEILSDPLTRDRMKTELRKWHYPNAADEIIDAILPPAAREQQPEPKPGILKFRTG
jgi:UDP-N-acetylglucosamine--N-acetylmuramyl-(pentapeptide) pyrophosphoryl-undecaprenol N-acetylglucosamine transferase